ncbi:MAG: acyl-CoA dehydratase activase [Myxococcota bacterium]
MYYLGFDFGSVFNKAILLNENREILLYFYERANEDRLLFVQRVIMESTKKTKEERFIFGFTGVRPEKEHPFNKFYTGEIVAVKSGASYLHPEAVSIIEIGGHSLKYIILSKDGKREMVSFSTNEACAAGTGSFIEQQAKRLELSIEELSRISSKAKKYARIAGRCSVFAKSDMIHLQQKGTPLEEIAYGLCVAIVRNAISTLLKGSDVPTPAVVAGGCARNEGIIRAFNEHVFKRLPQNAIPSKMPGIESALGSALNIFETENKPYTSAEIVNYFSTILFDKKISQKKEGYQILSTHLTEESLFEPEDIYTDRKEGYLGVDVGSVSTDLVVLDKDLKVISAVYLPTKSRPVEAVYKGIEIIKSRFKGGLEILGCGTTGSGRYLAAKLLNADVIKNEITCQTLGASLFFPDVDTIFEIGGQDSKFISVKDGNVIDFQMNRICSAGTGSFLEEQAAELGVEIKGEFSKLAFKSTSPIELSSRCTVFMETEVVNALKQNLPIGDIVAGLAYSIAKNYLEKVAGQKKIGDNILFQGGVASNRAVIAAFENILGKKIKVNPYNRISGAIGAAYAARLETKGKSSFVFPDISILPTLRSFECRQCSNNCEVNIVETKGMRAYFGDTCEKYTSGEIKSENKILLPNLSTEYLEMAKRYFKDYELRDRTIGIPLASVIYAYLPFFATFFGSLGLKPVLSEPSQEKTLTEGLRRLTVGACLPVKLTAGHIADLIQKKTELVFIPAMFLLSGEEGKNLYACPYTQAIPFMVNADNNDTTIISPVVSLSNSKEFINEMMKYKKILNTDEKNLRRALNLALEAQSEFEENFKKYVKSIIEKGDYKYLFCIIGKPYNTFDPYINLNLFERLRRMGILAVPAAFLGLDTSGIETNLPWKFSADIYKYVSAISKEKREVYPVIISNFGCGPDAFTFKQIEEQLKGIEHLILEFDEQRGEAGLITRLEAFCDQIEHSKMKKRHPITFIKRERPLKDSFPEPSAVEIVIPYFADQVFAFSGLFKYKGYKVRVLNLPDERIQSLGERYSLGKECHAYSILLGDLVNIAIKAKDTDRSVVFYLPGTQIPCLMHQYGEGMAVLLSDLGVKNVSVLSPNGDQLIHAMGLEAIERYYKGLWAIELLEKAVCEIRPYEVEKGLTDMIHRTNLTLIEQAIAYGDVYEALDASLKNLSQIRINKSEARPLIGVAGDVYTRVNPIANFDLYKKIEEAGCEVWPSPFQIDLIDFGIYRKFYNSLSKLNLQETLKHGALVAKKAIEEFRVSRIIDGRIKRADEPTYNEMVKLASKYVWNEASDLLFLNVAKIVDFAQRGADGIINAICFNCMVGNASNAVIEKIRRDYSNIPIITTVYSNTDDPLRDTILDAFLHQAKTRFRNRVRD